MSVERVHLIREIVLTYEATASFDVTLHSDHPDTQLIARRTYTIPASTGSTRKAYRFRVHGDFKASQFKWVINSSQNGAFIAMYEARAYVKATGEAYPWVWLDILPEDMKASPWTMLPLHGLEGQQDWRMVPLDVPAQRQTHPEWVELPIDGITEN